MKLFYYDKDDYENSYPDWRWAFLCFKPLDILGFKLYKMQQYTWKECFNFGFSFFDYSLVEFDFTIGNYDGIITLLDFSNGRSFKHEFFKANYSIRRG